MEWLDTGIEVAVPPLVTPKRKKKPPEGAPDPSSMPIYPGELTHGYTNGYDVAVIPAPDHNPAYLRLVYFVIEDRRGRFVEIKSIGGQLTAVSPPELAGDNTVEGLMVFPRLVWIDAPNGRQQLRLYVVAASADGRKWTLRFAYPDPKIYRQRQ